jgi:hypothetical protein
MQGERLIHDSGKVELWARLFFSAIGLLGIVGLFLCVVRNAIIPAIFLGAIGIFLLSIWFWRSRLFYDSSSQQLIVRSASTLWMPWRISLSCAESLYIREVAKAGGFSGGSFVDIGLRYQGGRQMWIMRQPLGDPDHVAIVIAKATGLPIIQI